MFLESIMPDKQFRRPAGWLGLFMAKVLDWVNASQNDWVIELLEVKLADKILEIGFGSGRAIKIVSKFAKNGFVAGIDFSKIMVKKASKLNKAEIKTGRVEIKLGEAGNLPYADNFFDKVFAVYVIYFWDNPEKVLQEIKRVLKPGGRVVVFLAAKIAAENNSLLRNKDFKMYSEKELEQMFKQAGFTNVLFKNKIFSGEEKICVLANK